MNEINEAERPDDSMQFNGILGKTMERYMPNENSKILQSGNHSRGRVGRISYLPTISRDIKLIKNRELIETIGRFSISRDKNGNSTYMHMISAINQLLATKGPPHPPTKEYPPVMLNIMSLITGKLGLDAQPNFEKPAKKCPVS
jgi:hypothetical protein